MGGFRGESPEQPLLPFVDIYCRVFFGLGQKQTRLLGVPTSSPNPQAKADRRPRTQRKGGGPLVQNGCRRVGKAV